MKAFMYVRSDRVIWRVIICLVRMATTLVLETKTWHELGALNQLACLTWFQTLDFSGVSYLQRERNDQVRLTMILTSQDTLEVMGTIHSLTDRLEKCDSGE